MQDLNCDGAALVLADLEPPLSLPMGSRRFRDAVMARCVGYRLTEA